MVGSGEKGVRRKKMIFGFVVIFCAKRSVKALKATEFGIRNKEDVVPRLN